jgi:FtsP/CotA-like multicopper oxidase with cupredoxin domain
VKLGLAAGGLTFLPSRRALADRRELLKYLCPPDDRPRQINDQPPSPPAELWKAELFVPPVMKEQTQPLSPPPDPSAHQRYKDFEPQKFYEIHEREMQWQYHPDPPYTKYKEGTQEIEKVSWSWGFQAVTDDPSKPSPSTPGPTYAARYGEPVLVRRYNDLPPIGQAKVNFALPSTTSHLHNAHTASESDGNPVDWIDTGEFWDHHYGNFPAGHDPLQKLTTLWYHDHRLDFTAANVYAGLAGFYFLFDDQDTGDENQGWKLPSFPKFDIPLIIQDIRFAEDEDGVAQPVFDAWNTDGMLGDRMTVNRRITPRFTVEARRYRFRILNGGPSRFYELFLRSSRTEEGLRNPSFKIITGDGNFLPEPVVSESVFLGVAQRVDVILDFTNFAPGDHVYLHNLLQQLNGAGPTGAYMDFDDPNTKDPKTSLLRFDVVGTSGPDNSSIPKAFRPWPRIDLAEVKRERIFTFDYEGGLWTINSQVMDPNRIDAGIDQGSAEIWTFRNGGRNWSHPIHSHFVEFLFLEINGQPYKEEYIQDISGADAEGRALDIGAPGETADGFSTVGTFMGGRRRDVAILLPSDEMKLYMRWPDFLGKYVMHCHNVVHEDHAMMIRWDIMEPGKGFEHPRSADEVYAPPPETPPHVQINPSSPVSMEGQSPPPPGRPPEE